jgi:hypothetical protein
VERPWSARLEDERTNFALVRRAFHPRIDDEHVGDGRVGDERLFAPEGEPAIGSPAGDGAQRERIASSLGLGERPAADARETDQRRRPALALRQRTPAQQRLTAKAQRGAKRKRETRQHARQLVQQRAGQLGAGEQRVVRGRVARRVARELRKTQRLGQLAHERDQRH